MNRTLIITLFILLFPSGITAKELGSAGNVWKIKERNLITVMKERLAQKFNGQTDEQIQEELRRRTEERSLRPAPVAGITRATETAVHYFDPSFTLTKDIADDKGVVFARKGEVFNPFDISGFTQTLVFIDGDDPEQITWVKQFKPKTIRSKIILVNGNIKDTEELLDTRIYFDQLGELTGRFGIKRVPAVIEDAGDNKNLRITEVGL
ncbi:type-F conjugative transfer system protein TraW [Morganella morganii]|uniref:IncF plasmid conjugative transfer pilus assembly protein TraW n=1 Tax=Morganella morganii TaxID=582 RepID=A0A6B8DIZ5_MORMO|nr:type-F conjugative transfer system protein TraW [Morganella morganii]HBT7313186.1 type-F conjugative transfer system protein TraW [Klebsiella pneumoniae]EGT3611244.1 type-F conjugative transfer system protein TraW [Morganella morganii]EKW8501121.1 type-F conjugative transfer system protein TraW [Morganella morganii]MBS9572187.1 type-F conjugative transfer system protein TraW [Morganella morganii subsp. morganii]MBS9585613.1 type-F conjugative transfer system protein TraW [Morganella morgani